MLRAMKSNYLNERFNEILFFVTFIYFLSFEQNLKDV